MSAELLKKLADTKWRYSKTYSEKAPHEYILKEKEPELYDELYSKIKTEGVNEKFWKTTVKYYYLGNFKYWAYPELINRVRLDGFHRYSIMKTHKDIYDSTGGLLPIVVLDKDINERMAATIRHNRARGKHSVAGMGNVVFNMLKNGVSDEEICNELGLESEELVRLKHITGFSKLFSNVQYGKSWESDKQINIKRDFKENNPNEPIRA